MDTFMEKLVEKKKKPADYLISAGIITAGIILIIISLFVTFLRSLFPLIAAGILYLVYLQITSRNIEYEYIFTNGDLDIDKISAKRKRKRIFSSNCNSFEKLAKYCDNYYDPEAKGIENRLEYVSAMDSPDVYFMILNYKNKRTIVFFEPGERILDSIKTYIPRKVFM